MIVQVDYRIEKPYKERLSIIESLVLERMDKQKHIDIELISKQLFNPICYKCMKPIKKTEDEVLFMEIYFHGLGKTYLHLSCVKQKF